MNPFVFLLPTLLIAIAITYGVGRALGRVWIEHKVRMALLEKLGTHPELIPSFQELEQLVSSVSATNVAPKQDFTITGAILAVIGLSCIMWGRTFSMGRLSVGLYFGGLACVCLGFLLSLAGLLIRNTRRLPVPPAGEQT